MVDNNVIVKGDMVEHCFRKNEDTKKPVKYKVLEVKEKPGVIEKFGELFNNAGFKNLRCLSENGEYGLLSSDEVEKVN